MIARLLFVAIGLGALATAAGFLGAVSWVADLFSHFRVQYALGLLACAGVGAALRRTHAVAVALVLALLNGAVVAAAAWPRAEGPEPGSVGPILRVVALNVARENTDYEAIAAYLEAAEADVIGLVEAHPELLDALAPALEALYPHGHSQPQVDCFGQAVYSRHPITRSRVGRFGSRRAPASVLDLDVDGVPTTFVLVHPDPPIAAEWWEGRNAQLADIAKHRNEMHDTLVVCGDFNATAWAPIFGAFERAAGLSTVARGLDALVPTWPSPLGVLGIPIDHCLVSPDVVPLGHEVGPDVGSDHRPLRVELGLPVPR